MAAPRIRLGIIGAGIMGERMLRAALDHASEVVEVTAVWDASGAALERLRGVGPGGTASAAAAIEAADCVYVATPPATHLEYADMALAAGRAVFLEKPLSADVPAARAFVARTAAAPSAAYPTAAARIAVNFPFASSFAVERLRTWLDEGAIGAPARLSIDVAFATWPRAWQQAAAAWLDAPAEGGFTREVVSHFLFLARRLLGPLELRAATTERVEGRAERMVRASLDAGGIPVSLSGAVGTTQKEDHNTWTLEGTGAMRLRDWSWAERQRPDGSWAPDPDAAPNERMRPLVLRRQLEGVARMTRGEPHHLATVAEAFEVQEVVEAILARGSLDG